MSVTDWRGRLQEEQDPNNDNLPIDESIPLRREARSLLISLLRPYRWIVAVLALVVIVEKLRGFRFRSWCNAASTTASRRSSRAALRVSSW